MENRLERLVESRGLDGGTEVGWKPSVYVASPLGFSEPGRLFYREVLLPALMRAGLEPFDPWAGDASERLETAQALPPGPERFAALRRINQEIGEANRLGIVESSMMLAVLDGTDLDSGTAAEVGYAAALGRPIIGLRTDFRNVGDNEAAQINLQVLHFVHLTGGALVGTLDEAVTELRSAVASRINKGS